MIDAIWNSFKASILSTSRLIGTNWATSSIAGAEICIEHVLAICMTRELELEKQPTNEDVAMPRQQPNRFDDTVPVVAVDPCREIGAEAADRATTAEHDESSRMSISMRANSGTSK